MYYIESDLDQKTYLKELKRSFRNPFLIFDERVCGITVGPFFSVAYHSPYEWNRRITSECNRAWGYVKEREGKTEVNFIRGKGLLSLFWLVVYTLLCAFIFLIASQRSCFDISEYPSVFWGFSVLISFVVCGISAFHSSITEAGEQGANEITRLLRNPKEYY